MPGLTGENEKAREESASPRSLSFSIDDQDRPDCPSANFLGVLLQVTQPGYTQDNRNKNCPHLT